MMRLPAKLLDYSLLNWLISDLDNFTLVPHLNYCKLIWKSPIFFG